MSGYALTPLAKADIFDIWSYIAEDNEDAATRVEQAIYDACAFVAEAPYVAIPDPISQHESFINDFCCNGDHDDRSRKNHSH